jgi:hypothetical protein
MQKTQFKNNIQSDPIQSDPIQSNIIMRDQASSNANDNFAKSTIVKSGSSFTSPKMVTDLQSSLSLPNRPRILSLEFHSSSPRPLPRMPLLPRNLSKLSKKLVEKHEAGTRDFYSMDRYALTPVKKIRLCIRPKALDARSVRALGLGLGFPQSPAMSSSVKENANGELPLRPRAERLDKHGIYLTPAPSIGGSRDISIPGFPVLERDQESRILRSLSMPRELFVPDDF